MAKLKRELGLMQAILVGLGVIFGAGIYALIGEGAATSGNALWLSFVISAVVAGFTGLSYAELSSSFPDAGGEYEYTRCFKRRVSSLVGWMVLASAIISSATVCLGFAGYLKALIGSEIIVGALILLLAITFVLIYGIKQSALMASLFTLIEASGLMIIIFIGLPHLGSVDYFSMPFGLQGVLVSASIIFFAFLGFEDMVKLAEETKNPKKTIPKALIISLLIATIVYCLVAASAVSVMPWQQLSASKSPIADVAATAFGGSAFVLLSVIALFATANTVLLMMLAGSRILMDMARDRIFPKAFSVVLKKRRTPALATAAVSVCVLAFVLSGDIRFAASFTNFTLFFTFIFVNFAVILLRKRRDYNPLFVSPSFGRVPIFAWLGVIASFLMILNLDSQAIFFGLILIIAGALFFYAYEKLVRR